MGPEHWQYGRRNTAQPVIAVDIAAAAMRNTKRNVERLGFEGHIEVRTGHVFSSIASSESFDHPRESSW